MARVRPRIRFRTTLLRPGGKDKGAPWAFVLLPRSASEQLPSRGKVSVEGSLNGVNFAATLEPDGRGGHWLKVGPELREASGAQHGHGVELEISPAAVEPEPEVPEDVRAALDVAPAKAAATWRSLTPAARRDYIFWIVSCKKAETRAKRIGVAIDKLSKGARRPCCFDRSGMFDKSLSCPIADDEP